MTLSQYICSIIRSVVEYCFQVWHPGLTKQQYNEIEFVQKDALKSFSQLSPMIMHYKFLAYKNFRNVEND